MCRFKFIQCYKISFKTKNQTSKTKVKISSLNPKHLAVNYANMKLSKNKVSYHIKVLTKRIKNKNVQNPSIIIFRLVQNRDFKWQRPKQISRNCQSWLDFNFLRPAERLPSRRARNRWNSRPWRNYNHLRRSKTSDTIVLCIWFWRLDTR